MTDTPDDLADLLTVWWRAEQRSELAALGMPRECPSTRGFRSTALWNAENDDDVGWYWPAAVRAVASAVDALPGVQRAAVHVAARNLATGAQVWVSSRLPADPAARDAVFAGAFSALRHALRLDLRDAA